MAKNHNNEEGSKDPEHYPLSDAPGEGKGKQGAHADVQGKQKDREMKEWEQNDFWKAQEADEEGKKMKTRKEEGRTEEEGRRFDPELIEESKRIGSECDRRPFDLDALMGEGKRNG